MALARIQWREAVGSIAVIDFEASGLGARSHPIEVAVVCSDGRDWTTLIRPEPDWTVWDPAAECIHRIPRDQVVREGMPPSAVVAQLEALLTGQTLYCDAWLHDHHWLHRLYAATSRYPSFRLESVFARLNEHQQLRWRWEKQCAARRLGLVPHRALADARIVRAALTRLCTPTERPVHPAPLAMGTPSGAWRH